MGHGQPPWMPLAWTNRRVSAIEETVQRKEPVAGACSPHQDRFPVEVDVAPSIAVH